jgi:hypothetical protein
MPAEQEADPIVPGGADLELERLAPFVIAAAWVVVGLAMILWPERARSLTIPDWQRHGKSWLSLTNLVWYRFSGLGLVLIGSVTIYLLANRTQ